MVDYHTKVAGEGNGVPGGGRVGGGGRIAAEANPSGRRYLVQRELGMAAAGKVPTATGGVEGVGSGGGGARGV